MDFHTRMKYTAKWSIFTAAVFALFWGIWYAAAGSVPNAPLRLLKIIGVNNPPHISRWWDVLQGPFWTYLLLRWRGETKLQNFFSTDLSTPWIINVFMGVILGCAAFDPANTPSRIQVATKAYALFLSVIAVTNALTASVSAKDEPPLVKLSAALGFCVVAGAAGGLGGGIIVGFMLATTIAAGVLSLFLVFSFLPAAVRGLAHWLTS